MFRAFKSLFELFNHPTAGVITAIDWYLCNYLKKNAQNCFTLGLLVYNGLIERRPTQLGIRALGRRGPVIQLSGAILC